MAKYIPISVQNLVKERSRGYCEYCYAPSGFSPDTFPIEHIIPLSLNGNSEPENLAQSCDGCNGHKYTRISHIDPLTQQKSRLFHPRTDYWPDHFQWNEDETIILGITPIGRATVDLLNVNRPGNINLRKLLKQAGLHPPESYPTD